MNAGFFIALEGGEGAGKSTQTKLLADYLRDQGLEVVVTREPGGTPTAEKIRTLLLDPTIANMPATTEALLFAAARADHVANFIRPALERGAIVICDRYIDSSVAYQGIARGLGAEYVRNLSEWATGATLPNLTIYLNVPVEESTSRMDGTDRMEVESFEFHQRVNAAFVEISQNNLASHITIDGTQSPEQISGEICAAVQQALNEKSKLS